MKTAPKKRRRVKEYGQYIVADPGICHGALTFRGTRIFVNDVLNQVSKGMDWDEIIREWRGSVTREAIAETVQLAKASLIKNHQLPRRRASGHLSTSIEGYFPRLGHR